MNPSFSDQTFPTAPGQIPHRPLRTCAKSLLLGASWLLVMGCPSDDPPTPKDPGPDVLSGVFETPVPDEAFIELTIDGETVDVAEDQIVVLFEADADLEPTLDALLDAVDGEVLGRLGDLGLFQIGVDADESSEFDAVFGAAEAVPGVLAVAYQVPIELLADPGGVCDPPDDLLRIPPEGSPGCELGHLDYRGLSIVWDAVAPVPLHPVRVVVIDTGVAVASGAFDDLNHEPLVPGEKHTISHAHGTKVAGIIAADDLDDHTNGIASRFLEDELTLISRPVNSYSSFSLWIDMHRAALREADIVNISMSQKPGLLLNHSYHAFYRRVLDNAPNTLFVAAAGNDGVIVDGSRMPAGVDHPHLLIVGGTKPCDPNQRATWSNHGAMVDVAAPYTMPVVYYHPTKAPQVTSYTLASGTSYSSPVVTSLAAILASIDPDLSPVQLADRIRTHTWPTEMDVVHGRVVLSSPILATLHDKVPAARDIVAPGGVLATTAATIVDGMCGETTVTIEGVDPFTFTPLPDVTDGLWSNDDVHLMPNNGVDQFVNAIVHDARPALNTPYAFPGQATFSMLWPEGDLQAIATATSGTMTLTGCSVTTRRLDGSNVPHLVRVDATGTGDATVLNLPGEPLPVTRAFDAELHLEIEVLSNVRQETLDHVETLCGG